MISNLPPDISAETILNYLPRHERDAELKGTHRRNAYEDILSISERERLLIELSRDSIYDILPEALFHPIDRFENIPANEYKERFAEEVEMLQIEESNARRYFAPFDKFILEMGCIVSKIKNDCYGNLSIITDIICDSISENTGKNRFIKKLFPFMPICRRIRGDRNLITILLRKILSDEGIEMKLQEIPQLFMDKTPRYSSILDLDNSENFYLGNEYIESVTEYEVKYWSEDDCDETFLTFISEIAEFERFINDYFVGIESSVKFNITTIDRPIRLSDNLYYNYLDYNTNI